MGCRDMCLPRLMDDRKASQHDVVPARLWVKTKVISGHGWFRSIKMYFQRKMLTKCRCWSQFWPLCLVPACALAPLSRLREEPGSEMLSPFPSHDSAGLAWLAIKNSSVKRNCGALSYPECIFPRSQEIHCVLILEWMVSWITFFFTNSPLWLA